MLQTPADCFQVDACEHSTRCMSGAALVHWARWLLWQQRKALSHVLGRRAVLSYFVAKWREYVMQHDAVASAFQVLTLEAVHGMLCIALHNHHHLCV